MIMRISAFENLKVKNIQEVCNKIFSILNSSESHLEEDEEAADTSAATATPSTIEQLGKAIKFIGTFVSWARAINPSTETSLADEYAHSNAAAQVAGGGEEQPQLRKGLIGEPRVDSGE